MPFGMDLDPGLEQSCLRILQIRVCDITKIAGLNKHVVLKTDVVHSDMKIDFHAPVELQYDPAIHGKQVEAPARC